MLFCSEKFYGWVGGGDIAIIATSSRSRSLIRDLRWTLDLDPSLTILTWVTFEKMQGVVGGGLGILNYKQLSSDSKQL